MSSTRVLSAVISALILLCCAGGCARGEGTENRFGPVVATINSEPVNLKEFHEYLTRTSSPAASSMPMLMSLHYLNLLIDHKLIMAEIERQQITVLPGRISTTIRSLGIEEDLRTPQIRQTIAERLMIEKLIDMVISPRVVVTDEDVQVYYSANSELFQSPAQAKTKMILLADKKQADDLRRQLRRGADFAQLAREHSAGLEAEKGGDMGWVAKGWFPAEIDEPLFEQKPGKVSKVIKSAWGYHLLLVEEFKDEQTIELDQVRERIREEIETGKQEQVYADWLVQLKKRAKIEINYQML